MPIRKSDYPPDWDAISLQVRTEAGWKCEWCCAPNAEWIKRFKRPSELRQVSICGQDRMVSFLDFEVSFTSLAGLISDKEMKAAGYVKIVLTVAHLDRNSENNERSNLAALCQRCHLNYDRAAQHIPNRMWGRYHNKLPQLKLEL